MIKQPGPIDRHVGSRLRVARLTRKMTQETLAAALGITFQQVQKYEKATNRVPSGRLQRAAEVLGVPVAWFFGGIETDGGTPGEEDPTEMMTPEAINLLRAFQAIKSPSVRKSILKFACGLTETDTTSAADIDEAA